MSAYASLPGSFLPFFAFGAPPSPSENDGPEPKTGGVDTAVGVDSSVLPNDASKDSPDSPSSCTDLSKKGILPSTFKALTLSSETDTCPKVPPTASTPSQPSDIIIAIRSARVDPVQLIKSLTSKGSNIARRTANFIARTPTVDSTTTAESVAAHTTTEEHGNAEKKGGSGDDASVFSWPGLCYEDSDSDEEYSMYDYSDDFSTPNNDEENDDEQTNSDGDPSAIEFDLCITFQGRKYNAKRAFPTFVKLREDLLQEMHNNDLKSKRSGTIGVAKSHSNSTSSKFKNTIAMKDGSMEERLSVPELPRVSPESLGHGGYGVSGAAVGVARSGFALLQATAQHYCPEMESWMRQVADTFPCSQSLSRFLWEPLSSSNTGWETIGEGNESISCNDMGGESIKPLSDVSASSKPPLHSRSKPKSSNSSKSSRFKSMGSIQEGDGNDSDEDFFW